MTFMQLVGINNITVSATAQIKRTAGLEVVLVLDNTGSMLCGPQDGAPNYNASLCAQNVVSLRYCLHEFQQRQPHLHPHQRRDQLRQHARPAR